MKKLHPKHIVPGFRYSYSSSPTISIIVTELCENKEECIVYDFNSDQYRTAVKKAIVESIKRGTILSLNVEEYSS